MTLLPLTLRNQFLRPVLRNKVCVGWEKVGVYEIEGTESEFPFVVVSQSLN